MIHKPAEGNVSGEAEAIYGVLSGCFFSVISVLLGHIVVSDGVDGGQGVEVRQQRRRTWFTPGSSGVYSSLQLSSTNLHAHKPAFDVV